MVAVLFQKLNNLMAITLFSQFSVRVQRFYSNNGCNRQNLMLYEIVFLLILQFLEIMNGKRDIMEYNTHRVYLS